VVRITVALKGEEKEQVGKVQRADFSEAMLVHLQCYIQTLTYARRG
jgi:hypothetical protein